MIEPHGERTVRVWVSQRQVKLGNSPCHKRGLACGGTARREAALGRLHDANDVAVAPHGEVRGEFAVVRSLARGHAVELNIIAADRDRLPGFDLRDSLEAPLALAESP